MSTNSLSSQNEKPFLTTSFPSSLPTPFEPLSPASSGPPASSSRLRNLYLLLFRCDRVLNRLTAVLSTPAGTDTLLATTCYTLQLLHANLNALLATQLQRLASKVLRSSRDALQPGETLIASLPAPRAAAFLARLSAGSKALSDVVADYRIFTRLWGLLAIYQWGKAAVFDPPADGVLVRIGLAQVAVNVAFQGLENLAYLGQHGVLQREPRLVLRDWVWSSRFWAAHVLLEFARLARVRVLWDRETLDGDDKEAKVKRKEAVEAWWRELLINVFYAPMTMHWSVENGLFSDGWIGFFGAMAGAVALRDLWKKTA